MLYKIQVDRVKVPNLISKFKFINTNQMSIHLYALHHINPYRTNVENRVSS